MHALLAVAQGAKSSGPTCHFSGPIIRITGGLYSMILHGHKKLSIPNMSRLSGSRNNIILKQRFLPVPMHRLVVRACGSVLLSTRPKTKLRPFQEKKADSRC
jgi:hypothetical protein